MTRIETIDPGFGIEIMSLAATLAEPLAPKQTISSLVEDRRWISPASSTRSPIEVGERHLYRFAPVASDLPERSVQKIASVAPDNGT